MASALFVAMVSPILLLLTHSTRWAPVVVRSAQGEVIHWPRLIGVVLSALALQIECGLSQEYELDGFVEFQNLVAPSGPDPIVLFRMSVLGHKWFVRITNPTDHLWRYQEAAFDGSSLYYVRTCDSGDSEVATEDYGKQAGGSVAWIYDGEVLHEVYAHTITPIWFAFASASYLNQLSDRKCEPIIFCPLSTGFYSLANPVREYADVLRHERAPNLPIRVAFFDDGYVRPAKGAGAVRRPPPYDNGFTNAIYLAESFTEVRGWMVPRIARLVAFAPRNHGRVSTDVLPHSSYIITVTNMAAHCTQTSFQPALPAKCTVTDARFLKKYGVLFPYSSEWLTEEGVLSSRAFKRLCALRSQVLPEPRDPSANNQVKASLLCLFCWPPVAYVCCRWRRLMCRRQRA